jgi:glycosyltransferase involved in cell wall biosynthesis
MDLLRSPGLIETELDNPMANTQAIPAVSIILPTYNRAGFLPQAFEAIRQQRWSDWELIVVDDGSTDNTRELVAELSCGWPQVVHYVYQENRGAYTARNRGLDLAQGRYVAFYDSDDRWLPDYLTKCVEALEANPEVDWVYTACRVVDQAAGRVLEPSTFHPGGRPRPFLRLRYRASGLLQIIDDTRALRFALLEGLYCGLQCSVIRSRVFDGVRFQVDPRNESEDQVFAARAVAAGCRFGYLDEVQVVYCIHGQNSSAAGVGSDPARTVRVIRELIAGYEAMRACVPLGVPDARALDRRLSREYFWRLGYTLWQMPSGRTEALRMYRRALGLWPYDLRFWKTYLLAISRQIVARRFVF